MEISISGYKNVKYHRMATNDKDLAMAFYGINKYTAILTEHHSYETKEVIYTVDWRK